MAKSPSKLLYTAGGWFLGGLVGGLIGAAVIIATAAMGAPAAVVSGVSLAVNIAAFATSVIGAVKGWKAASKAQAEYSAQSPSMSYQPSRSQDAGISAPQRSSEISGEYATRNDWAQSETERRNSALTSAEIQR